LNVSFHTLILPFCYYYTLSVLFEAFELFSKGSFLFKTLIDFPWKIFFRTSIFTLSRLALSIAFLINDLFLYNNMLNSTFDFL